MKKIICFLAGLWLLTGCTAEVPEPSESTAATTAPTETEVTAAPTTESGEVYQAPLIAAAAPIVVEESLSSDGTVLFSYTYQNLELTLEDPQVADAVTIDFLNRVDFENSSARSIHSSAQEDYAGQDDWIPYSFSTFYSPIRLDQNVLSLLGTQVVYDGGSRPASTSVSVSYDLLTGSPLTLKNILEADYSADTLCALINQSLDTYAQEGILYSDYAYVVTEMFSTNTPVESWYFAQDGLCFYFAPYEIAPYSAGTVTATIPYESLNGILKEQYFPAEQVDFSGTILTADFNSSDLDQFSQFAELNLDADGMELLLYTDGTVQNVRLELNTWAEDSFSPMSSTVVFAAATLCEGDALLIRAREETLQKLLVTYEADGTAVTCEIP